jgi:O-antigen ligase
MEKRIKITYLASTGLLTVILSFGVTMYIVEYEMVAESFKALGFPTYLVYPVGIAKLLVITTLWWKRLEMFREWSYAGLTYLLLLATSAHLVAGDGKYMAPIIVLVLVTVSYISRRKMKDKEPSNLTR